MHSVEKSFKKSHFTTKSRLKFSLLNKIAELMIEMNSLVIYNLFLDMFVQKYFGQKSIWNQSLRKVSVPNIFEIKIQFIKQNCRIYDWTKCFCDLQLISECVCSVTFCSKLNLKFVWSDILLQRHGFLAFFAIFLTWTTSNVLDPVCLN